MILTQTHIELITTILVPINEAERGAAYILATYLCHKFFTIFSYKLTWHPCRLFKLFHSGKNLSLLLTFAIESSHIKYGQKGKVRSVIDIISDKYLDKANDQDSFDVKFRDARRTLIFLKPFIDKYYLPDISTDESVEWKDLETYRSLYLAMEMIYLKMVSLMKDLPVNIDIRDEFMTFYDDMHCFFKFWKFSLAIPIERSDFSFRSKAIFVNLKDRFLISLRRNDANAKTFLVPLIYWCLNFTHPRNFDIRFFSSPRSQPFRSERFNLDNTL